MTVKYGLIGYGRWGALHAASIRKAKDAELVAVAVSSEKTAEKAKEEQRVDVYTDYRQLLQRDDIDVVDIVLPNHLHYEVAMNALQAGKHLLMEKPLALNVEDCEKIIEESERRNLLIHVGHELRFSSLWGKVKKYIEDGKIGVLKSAQINLSRHPFRDGANGWRKDIKRVGSWILEEPVHFYDLLKWYFEGSENPTQIFAMGNSRELHLEQQNLYENIMTNIRFSSGGFATFNQTLSAYEHHLTGEFIGTTGVIKVGWSGATDEVREPQFLMEYFDGDQKHSVPVEKPPGEVFELEFQIEQFTDVIMNNATPSVTAKDGLWAVKLCMAAQESVEQNKIIKI